MNDSAFIGKSYTCRLPPSRQKRSSANLLVPNVIHLHDGDVGGEEG